MSWCFSASCPRPQNPDDAQFCLTCGAKLLLGSRFRAERSLGQGGFGRTFLAIDESLSARPVCVIKQFFPQVQSTKAVQLFHEEAMRLDELGSHPQIPDLMAHFTEGDYHYLVQSYVDGPTLEQELANNGPFNEVQVRQVLTDLLPVLQFVHDRRVIHRDIKPANIVRQRSDGQLALVDFGASKLTTATNIGRTGTVIGSAGYAAPEQAAGKAIFASDLYSLGVTCIHLLTQVEPFDLYAFSDGRWVWRDYLQAPVSDDLGQVLDRLLDPAINRRYGSAVSALNDLKSPQTPQMPEAAVTLPPIVAEAEWHCVQTLCEHSNSVAAIAIHPNGKCFASGGFDKILNIWHLGTGALISRFTRHQAAVLAVAFNRDGQLLFSGSVDRTINLWNVRAEKLLYTLTEQANATLSLSMALSPDNQEIATGSDDQLLKIWQVSSGKVVRMIPHARAVTAIAISPDGTMVASGSSDDDVRLWNWSGGEWIATLKGHQRDINTVAFTPNGALLVSGSGDHTIKLWDVQTHSLQQTLHGHSDWVNAIAISSDGALLASASRDCTIRLWDLHQGKVLHTLTGHTKAVNAIAFSPDGKTLVSGSSDRTIKLWRYG